MKNEFSNYNSLMCVVWLDLGMAAAPHATFL